MKIGFIGAGNMGSALAKAAVKAEDTKVFVYDKDTDKANTVAKEIGAEYANGKRIAKECDLIFLAVKPNIIGIAIEEMKGELAGRRDATIVSMAAGISVAKIEGFLGEIKLPVIRIMPNTPASIGKGMILWCANDKVCEKKKKNFLTALDKAGMLDEIDESKIDAASAVSGCGPAFVYMFIEALADGGVKCGLSREQAQRYAAETVMGAAMMVKESGKHPGELKDAVCSPGGTTIEGVSALEKGAFRASAASAVTAAYEKTLKLGK